MDPVVHPPLPPDLPLTQPSQFQGGPLFFLCLTAAIALLYLFCRKKFDERSVNGNADYVYQLLPSELATRQEYNKGFLTYLGTMVFVVVALSLLGAKDLVFFGIDLKGVSSNVIPLAIAALLVGVIPNVPVLQEIEKRLRQYAHEMAYIPRSALATAEKLSTADFDFSAYGGDALQSDEMRGVDPSDFKQSRRTLEYAWARLGCLIYEQKSVLISGAADAIDTGLLRAYKNDLDTIEKDKKSMEQEVAVYRSERARNPAYTNKDLQAAIRNDLYKLYILLGCGVRLKKQPHKDINVALERFGFRLGKAEVEPTNINLKLVASGLIAGCVLALELGAALISQFGFWQPSPPFPGFELLYWDFVWALIPYVTAIFVADFVRVRAIKNNSWFDAAGRANGANYVRVALLCGAAGFAGVTAWGAVLAWPTVAGLKSDVFYALIAMATGGFYAWHLDNAELHTRPPRWLEIASQVLLTALCGFISATAAWSVTLGGSPGQVLDKIILVGTISIAVASILGWYLPEAATLARIDPLLQAMKDRIRRLEAAAIERLGDAEAKQWLDRPHAALGNKSPRAAASDVENFENAMALLQGPHALAA
jgi:hypothetical protein